MQTSLRNGLTRAKTRDLVYTFTRVIDFFHCLRN